MDSRPGLPCRGTPSSGFRPGLRSGWAAVCLELSRERGAWTPDQVCRAEGKKAREDSRSGGKPPRPRLGIERRSGHRGHGRAPGFWGPCVGCRRDRQTVSPETGCLYPVSQGLPGYPSRPALTPTPPLRWVHTPGLHPQGHALTPESCFRKLLAQQGETAPRPLSPICGHQA